MSYLLEQTTGDEILLMIAAEDGETRPLPHDPTPTWNAETDPYFNWHPPVQAPGFVALNITDNLMALYSAGLVYESRRSYRCMHLTWKGWDRVDELVRAGERLPTEQARREQSQLARICIENDLRPDQLQRVREPRGGRALATYRYVTDEPVATLARFWFRQAAVLLASRSNLRDGPRPVEYKVERRGWIQRWHVVGYQAKLVQ